jgi:hypothetical protein
MKDDARPALSIDGIPIICEGVNFQPFPEATGLANSHEIYYSRPLGLLTIEWGAGVVGEGPVDWVSVSTIVLTKTALQPFKRLDFRGWHPYRRTIECVHAMEDGPTQRTIKPKLTPFVKAAEHG